jgi:hypothetical protein
MTHMTKTGLTFALRRRSPAFGDATQPTVNAIQGRALPKGEDS